MARVTGGDPSAFHAVLDIREGKKKRRAIDTEATLHAYLDFVALATDEVDRKLEGSS